MKWFNRVTAMVTIFSAIALMTMAQSTAMAQGDPVQTFDSSNISQVPTVTQIAPIPDTTQPTSSAPAHYILLQERPAAFAQTVSVRQNVNQSAKRYRSKTVEVVKTTRSKDLPTIAIVPDTSTLIAIPVTSVCCESQPETLVISKIETKVRQRSHYRQGVSGYWVTQYEFPTWYSLQTK